MGEKMNAVTDAEFDADRAEERQAGPGRLLGRVVRPVPPGLPDPGGAGQDHSDKLTFLKMNVDENPVTPSNYRVTGIPTINVYVNGELAKSIVGAKPKAALLKELAAFTS